MANRFRVLIVAMYFPPDIGGSATRVQNVAKGLHLNGCEVTVIAAVPHYPLGDVPRQYRWRPLKVEWVDGVRVIRTFMFPLESKGFVSRLLHIGVFIISSMFAFPFIGRIDSVWASSWIPGIIYGRIKRIPVGLNVDDLTLEDLHGLKMLREKSLTSRIAELIYRVFYRMGDVVTPISQGYVDTIHEKYGVEKKRIWVVPGGVDIKIFKPRKSGSPNGQFKAIYSGSFSVAYDFEQILRAAKVLESKRCPVEFMIQGKGELSAQIGSEIERLKLSNVKLVNVLLSRDEVAEFLSQADVLTLPLANFGKPYRGMSSKLYEYQAVGKPIICCANGSPADYVRGTCSGLVVHPGDWRSLADAIVYLRENPEKAEEMGRRGRDFVETHLSIEAVGLQFKNILEECGHSSSLKAPALLRMITI